MKYDRELEFFGRILANIQLNSYIITDSSFPENIDRGLRGFLGITTEKKNIFAQLNQNFLHNIVYIIKDEFMCNYICFILPDTPDFRFFLCGPYITAEVTKKRLLENAEKYRISPHIFANITNYYGNMTLIEDESLLISMVNSLGEVLWGSIDSFSIQKQEKQSTINENDVINVFEEKSEQSLLAIEITEARYEAEKMLMDAVSKGQDHKVAHLVGHTSELVFETRTQDSLRNIKNYMVVMNTLLRKAAQEGGVPPYFIDKTSSEFAKKIEHSKDTKDIDNLSSEMVEKYSRLVREHTLKKYSACVQQAIAIIDYDLTADLSLNSISTSLKINPSYFSTLFKKESGKTFTFFVNEKRIENAKKLLASTNLQIQTVAQHCGILDVNYFTKLFKKHTGMTPGSFREKQ